MPAQACCSPNAEGRKTKATIDIAGEAFRATGLMITSRRAGRRGCPPLCAFAGHQPPPSHLRRRLSNPVSARGYLDIYGQVQGLQFAYDSWGGNDNLPAYQQARGAHAAVLALPLLRRPAPSRLPAAPSNRPQNGRPPHSAMRQGEQFQPSELALREGRTEAPALLTEARQQHSENPLLTLSLPAPVRGPRRRSTLPPLLSPLPAAVWPQPELLSLMDQHGIGTDATMANHIHKASGNYPPPKPTPAGLSPGA